MALVCGVAMCICELHVDDFSDEKALKVTVEAFCCVDALIGLVSMCS